MNSIDVSQPCACAFDHITFKGAAIFPNKGLCAYYSAARPALVFPNVHLSTFRREEKLRRRRRHKSERAGSGTTAAREATSLARSSYHRDIQYLPLHGTRGQTDRRCDVEVKSMHFVLLNMILLSFCLHYTLSLILLQANKDTTSNSKTDHMTGL